MKTNEITAADYQQAMSQVWDAVRGYCSDDDEAKNTITLAVENYLYDLSVPELARYTGRSLSAFKRDFKKVSDMTPEKWVLHRRLQEAHRLLSAGGRRVADAMLESGFKDPAFFSRAYRRQYGYSPRETPPSAP